MILSAHQPNFIPWTGYFLKVALSDIHIILDNVEYSKNGWTNRNKIQLSLESYITLPVRKKDTGLLISGVNLAENYKTAINKTRKTLRQFYGKSPGFEFIDSVFFDVIDLNTASLFNINYYILTRFLDFLEIDTPLILMSNIETNKELKGTDLLVSICSKNSCTQYLSGLGAKNYLDEQESKNLKIVQDLKTSDNLKNFEGLDIKMLARLAENNILTLDNFADLSIYELIDKNEGIFKDFDLDENTANKLIMKAREGWFTDNSKTDV